MEALLGFSGAVIGVVVSNLIQVWIAKSERRENRRKERLDFLNSALKDLIEARIKIQSTVNNQEQSAAILQAYAVGISVNDPELRDLAQNLFDDGFAVEAPRIDHLIRRLGDLHDEVLNEK